MESALANDRVKGNKERGPQDCSRERRQVSLWFNITTVPAGRGLCSIERDYKETKVKAALNLSQNRDREMNMVGDCEKRAESVGHQSLTKEV